MRRALKILGGFIGLLVVIAVVLVAMNWTLIRNMRSATGATVLDVDKFQPRVTVNGCDQGALPRYDGNRPLPATAFADMKAYSDSQGGVGLLVLIDGKVAGEVYADGSDENTLTMSYSMHKSAMALTYGAAIEDGIIQSIDEPIGTYLTEWADDPRGQIPIRAFLTMSSGIENPGFSEFRGMKMNLSNKVTATALELQPEKKPFEQFYYKSPDSQLAGAALNRAIKAAGKGSYAQYISKKLWCPVGADDALIWPEKIGGDPRFFAYLEADLESWARVGQMILQEGEFGGTQVIPASWIDAVTTPSATNPNYGLQTWLGSPYLALRGYAPTGGLQVPQSEPFLADDVIYFDGFGGQRVYIIPSANMIIARSGEPSFTWDESVLVNIALKAMAEG